MRAPAVLYTIEWTGEEGTTCRARATHTPATEMLDLLRQAGHHEARMFVAEVTVRAVPEPALDEPLVGDSAAVMAARLRAVREALTRPMSDGPF